MLILNSGHCQDKTESFLPLDVTTSRPMKDLSEGGWKVWEQASKPSDWTKVTSQHQSVPFSLEEQKKWQQYSGSAKKTKKGTGKKSASKPFGKSVVSEG